MFRRLIEIFTQSNDSISTVAAIEPPHIDNTEEFTFESLWDDYDRRTWHYRYAKNTGELSNRRLLNWIGSIDSSGYTREKCLKALITDISPGDENRILLRLADWVPQVQVIARNWTLDNFSALPLEAIQANQRLILYLTRKHRLENDMAMLAIKSNLLTRAANIPLSRFLKFDPMFRRLLLKLSLSGDQNLRRWILDDPEPFNRLLILREVAFTDLSNEEKKQLQSDKSVFVRRTLFYTQLEADIPLDQNLLISFALDSNRSLRELGQFYLKKDFGTDAYDIYQTSKAEQFFYIADYARKQDAENFLKGITSHSRSTQQNCLRALSLAAPELIKELDISALIQESRKFRDILVPLLPRLLTTHEIVELRSAFEISSQHGIIPFLHMLQKKSFWTFVDEGILILLSDPKPIVRQTIIDLIYRKTNVSSSISSKIKEQITSNIHKLRDHDQRKNKEIADLLEFIIKTTK